MRRFLQYRLRTLLILMLALAVPLGWWSYKAERQRKAVNALWKSGAGIDYDHNFTGGDPHPTLAHWRYQVKTVWLQPPVSDSDIEALQTLDGLKKVFLEFNKGADKDRVAREVHRVKAALPEAFVMSVYSIK